MRAAARREWAGIVCGTTDLGDADRIVRLLTPDLGRVAVVVRRARSRSAAATDLGASVRIAVGPLRDGLATARTIEAIGAPGRARGTLVRIALLSWGCELVGALAPEHAPAERLHGLLVAWLALLEGPREPGVAHRLALEAKAATFAGLAPALVRCVACGRPIDDPAVFDADSGGAAHARCGGGARVSAAGLAAVEALRRTPLAAIDGPPPAIPPFLLTAFVEHHLGRALASRALLDAAG